ncbi:helix-turn-helix domain-containing protein [Oxynema sp. CENA135]|uniref:helix-turn-helix domain-containing protein n=1 Tax=Oxynema sp. CENA135 TaxID=984206 RepID=UPI001909D6EB|nr:helix-turn-helix domain-containing protein [Oxynema sp. CENA135]MBK4730661.1 helix-turn-helix domain-containing protein [Oxynema sp. CENA135]
MTQKAFPYRFYPTPQPANLLRSTLGCTRLLYNRALAARTEGWYQSQERIGYKETSATIADWKKEDELSFLVERLPLKIREWECPECVHEHDRDVNAAINVLAAGQAVSVWVATVRPEESQSRLCWGYEAETQIVRSGNLGDLRPERMSNPGIDKLASHAALPQGAR